MALRYVVNSAALRPVFNSSKRGVATRTARDVLASAPAPELSALKNGLKIVSENNGRQTATVGLYIESGSRYETDANNGVATFLEHLVYKGTGKRSQSQLESELASIGATLDSYTSRDRTAFIVESASSDVEKVVDILADVIRNSKLDSLAIEAERQVLLKQLDEADSNIRQVVFDNLHAAAFQGTPLARSPLGTTENISSRITAKELKEWVEDNYKPVRIVLSGVGGVQHSQLESLAQKYFGDLTNEYPRKTPQVSGIRFTGSEYRYRDDNIPYMYGAIAVEGVGFGHHDALPLAVASTAVGQWDRTHAASLNAPSRLVQKISLDHGVHLFENFNIHYKDAGLFGIYFILDGKDLTDSAGVVKAVQKEWKHLSSGVTLDEINAAKNQLRTQLYQKLETNRGKAENLAKQALYTEGVKSLADLEAAIDAIDHTSVREAVSRHVYDRDVAAAGVGRTEAWPNYAHVRYGMSWWRL